MKLITNHKKIPLLDDCFHQQDEQPNARTTTGKPKWIFRVLCVVSLLHVVLFLGAMMHRTKRMSSVQKNSAEIINTTHPPTVTSPWSGLRILVAILAYDLSHQVYLENMIDSFRDMCETGSEVHMHVYTTVEWPRSLLQSLDRRVSSCRPDDKSARKMKLSVRKHSPDWKIRLGSLHRRLFYQHLDDYDLFVYSEDDHYIRPTNVAAFLRETAKLERLVGEKRFTDYSIGFLRYEVFKSSRMVFEHNWHGLKNFSTIHGVHHDGLIDSSTGMPLYFNGADSMHQGFYMATPVELRAWRNRMPKCKFDDIEQLYNAEYQMQREYTSSLQLYSTRR